jgi:hypothetical protein
MPLQLLSLMQDQLLQIRVLDLDVRKMAIQRKVSDQDAWRICVVGMHLHQETKTSGNLQQSLLKRLLK